MHVFEIFRIGFKFNCGFRHRWHLSGGSVVADHIRQMVQCLLPVNVNGLGSVGAFHQRFWFQKS